ncbi:Retrovirus-related Pol polyprotein from transposon RE1 [Vitis vinifera]|uniref:Retrovirus-related Pol polyprotein from transposon RE1 n=1 Tax=Vitis vinifera TaxID=29760 RepID=A0A438IJV1_VITVI|nr:Retrovirus-related Pol polyprotein from transposon RE1 [Vitis vinifera]
MATKNPIFTSIISGSPTITSEKLIGSENYLYWSASVELWFMGQGYEDHLVTLEDAISDVDKVQWKKINAQLCSVLWQYVDPKILHHLRAYKTCFKFWTQAKGLYTNDIQRFYKVVSDIVHVRQQDMDLSTYIGRIAFLKEEFLTLMPFTNGAGAQQIQTDKLFMVLTLIGLRPNLEYVRDQILANSSVLASQTNSRGGRSDNRGRGQHPQCTYCNKFGHTQDRCYQLHGRPPRTTHIAQSSDPLLPRPDSAASSTSQSITLTSNSRASDHMSGNKHFFSSITTTSALPTVTLANGSQTMAKGIGLAHHLLSLPLHSVFHAPECPFNLISISKITRTLNCSITFSDKSVILWDRSTGKTIGIGRESQGLYHLASPSSPVACISTDASLLIHSRLGHLGLSKFQKMVSRFSTLSSLACESCQLGRHTRVSFPKRLNNRAKSSFELVHIDVWGPCRTASTDKLSAKATKCIFLGYSRLQKAYCCYSPDTHPYFLSADVTFFEDSPFFSSSESLPISEVYHRRHCVVTPPLSSAEVPDDSPPIPPISPTPALSSTDHLPIALRKGNRSTRNPHPIYNFLSYHRLFSSYSAFVSTLSSIYLPKSTSEALSHPGWRQAMVDEMAALHSNGTWDLVSLPLGKFTVGCRWVYTVKVGPDGQVDRLKARLVAKVYTQIYGCDYSDTFSPIAKIASVRLFLSMAAICYWPLYQLDIKNAFLHGEFLEELYMEQPPGFVAQGESGLVCKLRRSLYGLKQSPRAWFGHFSSVVQEFGMLRSEADHSVFYHHNSSSQCIYLVVYVDDIVIKGSDQEGIQRLKQHLFNHFQTKDLGKLKYFLGLEIAQSNSGVVMSQRKYALDILEETGMLECKPVDTPMDPNVKLVPGQGEPLRDSGRYRRLDVVIRILRYIKGTPGQGMLYEEKGHTQIVGYTDVDWASSPSDRRSTSGYCVFVGGNLISWKSKKQDVVARLSAEVEYRAMALATCEVIWLRQLLHELRFGKDE